MNHQTDGQDHRLRRSVHQLVQRCFGPKSIFAEDRDGGGCCGYGCESLIATVNGGKLMGS